MTNVFYAHSFDFYATAHMNQMGWTASASAGAVSYSIGNFGRNATQGLRLARTSTANSNAIAKAVYAYTAAQIPIHGFAFRTNVLPPASSSRLMFQLLDAGTSQVDFFLLPNGTIQVKSGSTVLGTTTFVVAVNTWYFFEPTVKIDGTVGTVDLMVDEGNFESFSVLSLTGKNTKVTGNASANQVALCHQASDVNDISQNDFDDFYHTDPSDSVYPAAIGNIYVFAKRPNANGVHQDFSAVGAPTPYLAVNEPLEDEDTTYIKSAVLDNQASFVPSAVPINYDVLATVLTHISREESDSGRAAAPQWTIGGVDYLGTPQSLTVDYKAYPQVYTTSPATGVKWITPELNTAQPGEKITT